MVIKANGTPRFSCHETFEVAFRPVTIKDVTPTNIISNTIFVKVGRKKNPGIPGSGLIKNSLTEVEPGWDISLSHFLVCRGIYPDWCHGALIRQNIVDVLS